MRINFGCGPFPLPGWVNVDKVVWTPINNVHVDVCMVDMLGELPGWITGLTRVYCGHILSPVFPDGGFDFLQRVWDRMAPGGIIRICDFDADWLFSKFFSGGGWNPDWKNRRDWSEEERAVFQTPLEMLNADIKRWGRQYLLNADTVGSWLREIGFSRLTRCSEGRSAHEDLCNIEARLGIVQFCLEATK